MQKLICSKMVAIMVSCSCSGKHQYTDSMTDSIILLLADAAVLMIKIVSRGPCLLLELRACFLCLSLTLDLVLHQQNMID